MCLNQTDLTVYAEAVESNAARPGLREITREAVRARISDVALALVLDNGFESTTVDSIAADVGISTRSFNRYFPSKEDAILGDVVTWGQSLVETVATRPTDESAWDSLRAAYQALIAADTVPNEQRKRTVRVIMGTASLRARNLEKQLLWTELLTPEIAKRISGPNAVLRARALIAASQGCFNTALTAWAAEGETRSPAALCDIAFEAVKEN